LALIRRAGPDPSPAPIRDSEAEGSRGFRGLEIAPRL